MKERKLQIRLLFAFSAFIFICHFFVGCNEDSDFERDINFDTDWVTQTDTFPDKSITISSKDFDIDVRTDKVYLLELNTSNEILQLYLNNSIVYGSHSCNRYLFNLSGLIHEKNTIKFFISSDDQQPRVVNATLHCLNKVFIPDITSELCNGASSLQVDVKIRNAFNFEKQAVLQYEFFNPDDKLILTMETPVFLSGNTENLYRQKIKLEDLGKEGLHVRLVCRIISNSYVVDQFEKNVDIAADRSGISQITVEE